MNLTFNPKLKSVEELKTFISEYPGFPAPGIIFRDINPIIAKPAIWKLVIEKLSIKCDELKPDYIAGIEARGFIVGSALATKKELGLIPIRKKGKLPGEIYTKSYNLEYGSNSLLSTS